MMKQHLAIVIPAYKRTYLEEALTSIASQTCKDFTLYIGDDCSSFDLFSIIRPYQSKIDIVYKRFESNLGGKDLVAQWERCIDMTQGEEWLWLFSDDDVMEPDCVKEFYKCLHDNPNELFFHYNINRIDSKGKVLDKQPSWDSHVTTRQYLDGKLRGGYNTYVVEFILNRNLFMKVGRFQNYDLAWGSDFITWLKLSDVNNGIKTISGARVNWRDSGENISPNKDPDIIYRKLKSVIQYTKYVSDYAYTHYYGKPWFYAKFAIGECRRNRNLLSRTKYNDLVSYYEKVNNWPKGVKYIIRFLFYL